MLALLGSSGRRFGPVVFLSITLLVGRFPKIAAPKRTEEPRPPTGLFFVFGIRGENHCSCVTLVTFAFLITR